MDTSIEPVSSDAKIQKQHALVNELRNSPYLRHFQPRAYPLYEVRYYKPIEYLDQVGIENIAEMIQHGKCLKDIACLLDISSRVLNRWINSKPEYKQEVEEARQFAGDSLAYEAEKVLLAAPLMSEGIAKAKALADHYHWIAERLHKEQYGTKTVKHEGSIGVGVVFNMNIGVENVGTIIDGIVNDLPKIEETPQEIEE